MPDKKPTDRIINIVSNPPRPASGDGEVVVDFEGHDITLIWKSGNLVELRAASDDDGIVLEDMTIEGPLKVVSCKKCATDSDTGKTVCWPVPC